MKTIQDILNKRATQQFDIEYAKLINDYVIATEKLFGYNYPKEIHDIIVALHNSNSETCKVKFVSDSYEESKERYIESYTRQFVKAIDNIMQVKTEDY